uniref:Uncharacterized protein n=1 Tax=Anguilla anguilla TaxID=7936 RepID=A0A0E9QUT1_ANGAN
MQSRIYNLDAGTKREGLLRFDPRHGQGRKLVMVNKETP